MIPPKGGGVAPGINEGRLLLAQNVWRFSQVSSWQAVAPK
jgi:hypothetical protein